MKIMKKIILITVVAFVECSAFGQLKIGNLTVDSGTFKKYMVDLYSRPDTVKAKNEYDYMCMNCVVSEEQGQNAKRLANKFDENLEENNIGHVKVDEAWYYLMPRKPSEEDFVKWFNLHH